MKSTLYLIGADREPTPVKVVGHDLPFWQNVVVVLGAMASVATLYSVLTMRGRRK